MISLCALLDVFWDLKGSCHAKLTSVTPDCCLGWGTHLPLCFKPDPDSGNWQVSRNVPENISPPGPIMGPCAGRQVFLVERGNCCPVHLSLCRHCCHWGGTSANVPLNQHECFCQKIDFVKHDQQSIDSIPLATNSTARWASLSSPEFVRVSSHDKFIELWCWASILICR